MLAFIQYFTFCQKSYSTFSKSNTQKFSRNSMDSESLFLKIGIIFPLFRQPGKQPLEKGRLTRYVSGGTRNQILYDETRYIVNSG